MFNIPAIGTEQGVESTLCGMMEDKSYGHLKVDRGSPDPRPPEQRGWLARLIDRLRRRSP